MGAEEEGQVVGAEAAVGEVTGELQKNFLKFSRSTRGRSSRWEAFLRCGGVGGRGRLFGCYFWS